MFEGLELRAQAFGGAARTIGLVVVDMDGLLESNTHTPPNAD